VLVHGNVGRTEALHLANVLAQRFHSVPLPNPHRARPPLSRLPQGTTLVSADVPNESDPNSAVTYMYEIGPMLRCNTQAKQAYANAAVAAAEKGTRGMYLPDRTCLVRSASVMLLAKLLQQPAFNELRTKQQLGYIVQVQPLMRAAAGIDNATLPGTLVPWSDLVLYIMIVVQGTGKATTIDTSIAEFIVRVGAASAVNVHVL